jgi:hypothetical protein
MAAHRWRRWVLRAFAGLLALLFLLGLTGYGLAMRWAHKRVPVGTTVSLEDRLEVEARFADAGLATPDGGVVLEHPYDLPLSSRSLIVPPKWFTPPLKHVLAPSRPKASDVLKDVALLEEIIPRQYGGYDWAKKRGFDWDAFFSGWKKRLEPRGDEELSLEEAFAPMVELSERQLDNHTQIPMMLAGTMSESRSWKLARAPAGTCTEVTKTDGSKRPLMPGDPGEQPRHAKTPSADRSKLDEIWYLALPGRAGELKSVRCGDADVELTALGPPNPSMAASIFNEVTGPEPKVSKLGEHAVWFQVPSMNPGAYRNVADLKKGWPKPDGKEQVLLVDVRNNGGGDEDFGWQLLDGFIDRKQVTATDNRMHVRSCLYPAMRFNFGTMFGGLPRAGLSEEDRKEWQEDLATLTAETPEGCPRVVDVTPGNFHFKDRRPQPVPSGPLIIVWVDSGCGSDCEALTMDLATLPNTWLVGVNSAGVAQFIQPGLGVLPHTGLPFRFALGMSDIYGDERAFDGHGLDVDVVLPADQKWTPAEVIALEKLLR